ncbi:thiol reductant ABC exporter subunit CydD [Rhizosaccharibacter radicis]|uniref:Thiol reductant ABC exporter subunit CydD n=1 Tax=Rhizosaccharibacter radicis TaxID=2782605 RepID=A0ABT1VWA5_9PROT|nr:thiol reductant ABC exporter subunit CydD [Acetobacteraceae bacterium KSS12]
MTIDRAAIRGWSARQNRLGRRRALPVLVCGTLSGVAAVGQAWCMAGILAHALAAGRSGMLDPRVLTPPLLLFAFLAVTRAVLQGAGEVAAASAGVAGRRRLRAEVLQAVLRTGPRLLRQRHTGEVAALAVDRIEALDGFFSRWIPAATLAMVVPALVLFAVAVAQPRAALILLLCGVSVPVAQALFGIGAAVASRRQFLALSRLQVRFLDRIRGIATIVLFGQADAEAERLRIAADELRRRTMQVLRVAFLSSAALDLAMATALVAIALMDGRSLLAGGATSSWVGGLLVPRSLFALLLVPEFFAPLRAFALAYQDRMQVSGAAEQVLPLLGEAGEQAAEAPAAPAAPAVRTVVAYSVSVAFEGVSFSWDPARGRTLDDVSFRIPAQETLVLAGPSGSGKSTLIEMLLGFVRPDSGRITLNGADLDSIVPAALAQMTSWIGQKPVLFAGTLRDNVLFARPDATEAELRSALRAAAVESFLDVLPAGIDTVIGEGGFGLSGGQAQRVAVARAFLKNAPLLLLDEPTAHLDPGTEREILDSMRRLAVGRTVLLATHSVAAHSFSGRRVDLNQGRLLGRGGSAREMTA